MENWNNELKYLKIVVTLHKKSKDLKFEKLKFKSPSNYTVNHWVQSIRKKISIENDLAIYVYHKNYLLNNSGDLAKYYNLYKDKEGILNLNIGELSSYGFFN